MCSLVENDESDNSCFVRGVLVVQKAVGVCLVQTHEEIAQFTSRDLVEILAHFVMNP